MKQLTVLLLVVLTLVTAHSASAQRMRMKKDTGPVMPNSVLLFPATVSGTPSAATKDVQELVTDAVRKYLAKAGVGVTVYSRRLPSIQRAQNEGLKKDDAENGPGDDPRKAQRLADLTGAAEYLTVIVDDYKYDTDSHTASFNLSVFRNATADSAPLGTAAQQSTGTAPADVSASRQQGSAAARAAETAAAQVVDTLFPRPKMVEAPMKAMKMKKSDKVKQ